jgi:hypothetical protein
MTREEFIAAEAVKFKAPLGDLALVKGRRYYNSAEFQAMLCAKKESAERCTLIAYVGDKFTLVRSVLLLPFEYAELYFNVLPYSISEAVKEGYLTAMEKEIFLLEASSY